VIQTQFWILDFGLIKNLRVFAPLRETFSVPVNPD